MGFFESLFNSMLDYWWIGVVGLAVAGFIIVGNYHGSITSGPAVIDHPAQLNLRNCPAANCAIITQLNKGDEVFVTKSYDNGWKAVTVRSGDSASFKGFVNGDFLRGK
jgi:uncharacterized protein YgiM (DUF1202 family)